MAIRVGCARARRARGGISPCLAEADGDEMDDGYVSILADFQEGVRRPN